MLHWSLGVSLLDQFNNNTVWQQLVIALITEKMWGNPSTVVWTNSISNTHIIACTAYHFNIDGKSCAEDQRWKDTINMDIRIIP